MAFTIYFGLFSYNLGQNYLRKDGKMNVDLVKDNYNGIDKFMAGECNAQPTIGTGTIFYTLELLLLPKTKEKHKLRVPPFAANPKKI